MTGPNPCDKCRIAARATEQFTPTELDALRTRTGLTVAWRDGLPVISALLLPRCGVRHFAGMDAPAFVFWDTPAYRCPWARPDAAPAILAHGPPIFGGDGRYIVPIGLDEQGCWHKASHCPLHRDGYFIKPFADPALPRRPVEQ